MAAASSFAARMETHVARGIVELGQSPRAVVASLVMGFPGAYGSEAAFALTSVASGLENPVLHSQTGYFAERHMLYRCIAVLAADICAVETITGRRSTCAGIAKYWEDSGEIYFSRSHPDAAPQSDVN